MEEQDNKKEGMDMRIMSAGPTTVGPEKLQEMARPTTNTDLDPEYITFHRQTEQMISKLLHTEARSFLMLGEALLGLEAAMSSFIEEGDRVLVIHNGFFGRGFQYFVEMYGGIPVLLEGDYRRGLDPAMLREYLAKDSDFKLATLVHCETPSGILNPIESLCPLLADKGILSVVDAVSSIGGEDIDFDAIRADVLIGGSQKCLSVPAGLTLITLSPQGETVLARRTEPIRGFYANFKTHLTASSRTFPYTMNDTLVYALRRALEGALDPAFAKRHAEFGRRVRHTFTQCGFELYAKDHFANTVTTVLLPEDLSDVQVLDGMRKQGILISGGVGHLQGRSIRLGHMGDNLEEAWFQETFDALDVVFSSLGHSKSLRLGPAFRASAGP